MNITLRGFTQMEISGIKENRRLYYKLHRAYNNGILKTVIYNLGSLC